MKPLYQIGDIVFHTTKQKLGLVKAVFQDGAGHRYYVNHSGFTWSVPETSLDSKNIHFRPQVIQALTTHKISKMPAIKSKSRK